MATAALANYETAKSAVSALLDLESTYPDPPALSDRSLVEALRGGAAVLMVAAFEQYLKGAITEIVDRVNAASPPCDFDKLPNDLRVAVVYSSLDRAMKGSVGEGGKPKVERLPDVLTAISALQQRRVDGSAVAQTGGNPNPDTVKSMFKAVGISNVLAQAKRSFDALWGTSTASTFLVDQLTIVVNRRHLVAHTASALSVTTGDLVNGHRYLNVLVSVLDGILERHSQRIIATAQA